MRNIHLQIRHRLPCWLQLGPKPFKTRPRLGTKVKYSNFRKIFGSFKENPAPLRADVFDLVPSTNYSFWKRLFILNKKHKYYFLFLYIFQLIVHSMISLSVDGLISCIITLTATNLNGNYTKGNRASIKLVPHMMYRVCCTIKATRTSELCWFSICNSQM
jgi:hypothetical protein